MTDARRDPGAGATGAWGGMDWIAATVLTAVAGVVRALTWPAVFRASGVELVGPDAHYHLRRIQWSVENFPAVLSRDPYLRFPDGGEAIWSPAFDFGIASLARLLAGPGNPAGVESVAVWVPPVLGALTVTVLYVVARRSFGRWVAVVAASWLCLLPPHVAYSQLGFVDHHAAVALIAAALLGSTLAVVRDASPRPGGACLGLGAAMATALLVWPGALLHVATAQACLLVWIVAADTRRDAVRRAACVVLVHGTAFLLVAPFCSGRTWTAWGDVSPVVLSAFQPLWIGLPVIGLGAVMLAWRSGWGGASRVGRPLMLVGGLGLLASASLFAPEVREGIVSAARWFFRAEAFQAVVAESLPLFSDGHGFSAARAHAQLTPLVWLLPVAIAVVGLPSRRGPAHRVVAFWCLALLAATLLQYRFANSLSLLYALTGACSLDIARRSLAALSPLARRAIVAVGAVGLLVVTLPIVSSHAVAIGTAGRALRGETVRPAERVAHRDALKNAARWLGAHSPPTSGWSSRDDGAANATAAEAPAYGVLTAWGDGHITRYLARRPVVQDNFGDDLGRERFDQAESYYASRDETLALDIAADLRARYVLVRGSGSGHAPEPYTADSMLVRLYRARGSAVAPGPRSPATRSTPALARHRLLYESPDAAGERGGRYKIFEIVDGALVSGRAATGATVEARLTLRETPGGRSFEYRTSTLVPEDGRYSLRLPYPTTPFESRFTATGPYRLSVPGRARVMSLKESDVRDGARLAGPDLVD